jgi:hypothetical protein
MVACSSNMRDDTFCLLELNTVQWPTAPEIPSRRFRLFVAADITNLDAKIVAEFGRAALRNGTVYFCVWGPDCERFHDIVDELIAADDQGERLFAGPRKEDTVMTTWHKDETLEEALDFFLNLASPTEGFQAGSNFWVSICINNPKWAEGIRKHVAFV